MGMIRLQDIEKRYAFAPVSLSSAMSSAVRLYESQATSPELPSAILPGILQNVSQMDGPRPSASVAPSIW
jgi:hypothetical protein